MTSIAMLGKQNFFLFIPISYFQAYQVSFYMINEYNDGSGLRSLPQLNIAVWQQ